jgi:hypothetical protein
MFTVQNSTIVDARRRVAESGVRREHIAKALNHVEAAGVQASRSVPKTITV